MSLPNCPNGHSFTTSLDDTTHACLLCGAEWNAVPPIAPLPVPPVKSAKTRTKTGKSSDAQGQAGQVPLHSAGMQEENASVAESSPSVEDDVPVASTDHSSTARPRKTGSKKGAETALVDASEYSDPGAWHETQKCFVTSCMAKLKHDPPNVMVNTQKTYHYKCPNCIDVRVSVYVRQII